MQRPRLSIDIHPDLGKNPAEDEATLGPRSDNRARWLKFADCALHHHGATEEDIAELMDLASKSFLRVPESRLTIERRIAPQPDSNVGIG